ncbi:MAG: hypothetical protein H6Q90_14 [Deltaproteobacteria bacterium]|nr:hypothetical protein [Deltaproteobacteria bacterium]
MKRGAFATAALVAAVVPAYAQAPTSPSSGAPASTDASASVPAATASTTATGAEAPQEGIAVGLELGEPTSATAGWWKGKLGVSGALGTGTREGVGLSFHVDVQYVVARLAPNMAVRVGLGGRYYHHGYQAMSFDEIPDSHYGIRASAAFAYERGPLQLYAELSPGVDVHRTASCTLASGPFSICPHAQETPLFVQLVVGARWFLTR